MRQTSGFTLVELSIVLVILGLLVGGVLAGQSLIRNAELRSVASNLQSYSQSILAFRDKYSSMPGDMKNATNYWGTDATCPGNTSSAAPSGTNTCNGNGNGKIAISSASIDQYEAYYAWRHLSNAGMIAGKYSGQSGALSTAFSSFPTASNAPSSRLKNVGYTVRWIPNPSGNASWIPGDYGHVLEVDKFYVTSGPTYLGSLSPQNAQYIDQKLDDGRATTGAVLAFALTGTAPWYNPDCITGLTAANDYNLASTVDSSCMLLYVFAP